MCFSQLESKACGVSDSFVLLHLPVPSAQNSTWRALLTLNDYL